MNKRNNKRNIVIELSKSQQDEIMAATQIPLKSVVVGLDEEVKEIVFKGFIVNDPKGGNDGYLEKVKLRQPCFDHE